MRDLPGVIQITFIVIQDGSDVYKRTCHPERFGHRSLGAGG